MKNLIMMAFLLSYSVFYAQKKTVNIDKYIGSPVESIVIDNVKFNVVQIKSYAKDRYKDDNRYVKKAITAIQTDKKRMYLFEYWQHNNGDTRIVAYPLSKFTILKQ